MELGIFLFNLAIKLAKKKAGDNWAGSVPGGKAQSRKEGEVGEKKQVTPVPILTCASHPPSGRSACRGSEILLIVR